MLSGKLAETWLDGSVELSGDGWDERRSQILGEAVGGVAAWLQWRLWNCLEAVVGRVSEEFGGLVQRSQSVCGVVSGRSLSATGDEWWWRFLRVVERVWGLRWLCGLVVCVGVAGGDGAVSAVGRCVGIEWCAWSRGCVGAGLEEGLDGCVWATCARGWGGRSAGRLRPPRSPAAPRLPLPSPAPEGAGGRT